VQQPAPEPRHRGPNINISIPIIRVTPQHERRRRNDYESVNVPRVERAAPVVVEDVRGTTRVRLRRP
jgi:hypothetical protein